MNHAIKALTLCFLAFSFFGYGNEGSKHNLYENKLLISLPSELKFHDVDKVNRQNLSDEIKGLVAQTMKIFV